jgi:predicted glycoside hydrolase/deacetylase ChbG (UPF0249 family)
MSTVGDLGFEAEDRVVVVHVDDVGMSTPANQGALRAFGGAATCGSVMVPCPAFEEIASVARDQPELDLGVHFTLNAEYESYRWGPVADEVPGLVSPDGGMWRTTDETVANASPEEVERELRAQLDRALEAGIDVTHVDSHMGTVFNPKFVDVYVKLATEYRLPAFIPRVSREVLERTGMPESLERYVSLIERTEEVGFPLFDHFCSDSLSFSPGTGSDHNRERLKPLGPGLSYLITHCAEGGSQLESITDDWRQRDEEHRIYSDGTMVAAFEAEGMHTIGMRPLRDLLRSRL